MKGNKLLDKMELIDPAYVEAASHKPQKARGAWLKWGAIAACLCFLLSTFALILAISAYQGQANNGIQEDFTLDAAGINIGVDKDIYFPISFEQRKEYGLISEDAIGLTKENTYEITEVDIGEAIGTVMGSTDKTLNGCAVYRFAKYGEDKSICIVDTPEGYVFYVRSHFIKVENEIGTSFDAVLSAYDLPNSLKSMKLMTSDHQYVADIDDEAVIEAVFEIISGKINIGVQENERKCAKIWYDTYGNDDVFYSEEAGSCVYRESTTELHDKAVALYTEGERVVSVTTDEDYQLVIDYFPALCTFNCGDGFYELSPDEAEMLDSLLQIGK